MIEQIEYLESMTNTEPSQLIIDGLACIQMVLGVVINHNEYTDELIKELNNGG